MPIRLPALADVRDLVDAPVVTPSPSRPLDSLAFASFAALAALAGCGRSSAPAPSSDAGPVAASSSPSPSALGECTAATALVPGVPGSPGHLVPSPRNPNGVSELAAKMREMEADWRALRERMHDAGSAAPAPRDLASRHGRIRCAWPTQPSDRDAAFDARAVAYLDAVRAFEAAPGAERYEAVLGRCRSCHESVCTGALAAIEALSLPAPRR